MKFSTTTTVVAAVAALTIASFDIVVPKAVKAAVATLIRDVDNPARHPFTIECVSAVVQNSNTYQCATQFVPAGEEAVVETVAVHGFADATNKVVSVTLSATTAGLVRDYSFGPIIDSGLSQPNTASFGAVQPLRIYGDPGTPIVCSAQTAGTNFIGFQIVCTVSGYYVSLP
jgi:hypothetical protein